MIHKQFQNDYEMLKSQPIIHSNVDNKLMTNIQNDREHECWTNYIICSRHEAHTQMRINSGECIGRVLVRFCLVVAFICKQKKKNRNKKKTRSNNNRNHNYRFDYWIEGKTNRLQDSHMIFAFEWTAANRQFCMNILQHFFLVKKFVFNFVCLGVVRLSFINFCWCLRVRNDM